MAIREQYLTTDNLLPGRQGFVSVATDPFVMRDPRLLHVRAVVEANSFEVSALWDKFSGKRVQWKETSSGWLVNLGTFGGYPVFMSIRFAEMNGETICFWDQISVVAHSYACDDWLKTHLPADAQYCSAENFHHAVHHVERLMADAVCDLNHGRNPHQG